MQPYFFCNVFLGKLKIRIMKTRMIIGLIIISITLLNSCDFIWDCIDGNGIIESEYRDVEDFDGIVSEGAFDVYITQAENYEVMIETDENLLPFIITEKKRGNLVIRTLNHRCLNSSGDIKVFVSLPDIYEIELAGSGRIECDNIITDNLDVNLIGSGKILLGLSEDGYVETEKLDINHTGSGDIEVDVDADEIEVDLTGSGEIELYGTANETDLTISGSGRIDADELIQQECKAKITSSGRIYVYVEEYLEVVITGSGDVYYKGNPVISRKITGSGDIRENN